MPYSASTIAAQSPAPPALRCKKHVEQRAAAIEQTAVHTRVAPSSATGSEQPYVRLSAALHPAVPRRSPSRRCCRSRRRTARGSPLCIGGQRINDRRLRRVLHQQNRRIARSLPETRAPFPPLILRRYCPIMVPPWRPCRSAPVLWFIVSARTQSRYPLRATATAESGRRPSVRELRACAAPVSRAQRLPRCPRA